MMLRLGYDIQFQIPSSVAMVALLNVHPTRTADLRAPDELQVAPGTYVESFIDSFGNRCARFVAQQGTLRLSSMTLLEDPGSPDPANYSAREVPVQLLPVDNLRYLLNSRYCEVDRFPIIATELFGGIAPGWGRVQAICDWVHAKVAFGYQFARPTKTALDVFAERFRSVQGFSASCCDVLPRAEYPGAVCDGLPGRYTHTRFPGPDGFQRLV